MALIVALNIARSKKCGRACATKTTPPKTSISWLMQIPKTTKEEHSNPEHKQAANNNGDISGEHERRSLTMFKHEFDNFRHKAPNTLATAKDAFADRHPA